MRDRISFWRLHLLIVVVCLSNAALANTGELICQEDEGTKVGELRCSFKVDTTKPMEDRQLKHCTHDVCVTAVASIEPDNSHPEPTNQGKNDNDTNNNEDNQDDDTLKIGMATYRKPFAKYYPSEISLWLHQAPKTSTMGDDPLEWARWCGTLGSLHLRNHKGWYDLELAINVLQESLRLVEDLFDIRDDIMESYLVGDHEWDSFRASVYSNLGEAYHLDPDMKHGTEALDNYEKALTIYQFLVEEQDEADSSSTAATADYDSTRHVYALTLAKVGSALIQLHSVEPSGLFDSIENNNKNNKDLDGTMADMTSTTTISNFNENADDRIEDPNNNDTSGSRPPKLQRASEVLILAMEFYQAQCHKHLPAKDDNANAQSSSSPNTYKQNIPDPPKYVEACVDYATTLQYAASVESLAGNYQEALDYMKQALLVYTGDKDILHQEPPASAAVIDAVFVNVYFMWYRMGSTESIGSMLVNIADTCGQLGNHEESKTNYKLAMRFYSKFHIPPPPTSPQSAFGDGNAPVGEASMDQDTKAVLDSYLSMLQEYRRGTGSSSGSTTIDPNQPMYQQDDIYEGDILYNIGTMYMQSGDDKEGMEWFEQAVAVYQRSIHKPGTHVNNMDHTTKKKYHSNYGGSSRWSQIASMKASLTRIYFGQGRFEDSIRAHEECMDLFLELYGPGVNPYIQSLHEQVMQAAAEGAGSNSKDSADGGMIGTSSETTAAINLESYLQSIKNATEKLESLKDEQKKKKEEL